jgi:hypothetical protein
MERLKPLINMVKFRAYEEKDIAHDELDRWLAFLDETTPEEILEEIVKMDTVQRITGLDLNTIRSLH